MIRITTSLPAKNATPNPASITSEPDATPTAWADSSALIGRPHRFLYRMQIFGDPQSLNQYSYVRDIPTVKIDADGHCEGEDCQNIQVTVAVTGQPSISTWTSPRAGFASVSGQLTYTF